MVKTDDNALAENQGYSEYIYLIESNTFEKLGDMTISNSIELTNYVKTEDFESFKTEISENFRTNNLFFNQSPYVFYYGGITHVTSGETVSWQNLIKTSSYFDHSQKALSIDELYINSTGVIYDTQSLFNWEDFESNKTSLAYRKIGYGDTLPTSGYSNGDIFILI